MFAHEINKIDNTLTQLRDKADVIVTQYNAMSKRHRERRVPGNYPTLVPILRKRKNNLFYLYWGRVDFVRSTSGKYLFRPRDIPKGKGHSYCPHQLTRKSPEWEIEAVIETEQKLGAIRHKAALLAEIRKQLQHYEKEFAHEESTEPQAATG